MRLGRSNLRSNLERLLCLRSWERDGKGDVTDDESGGREECRDGRWSRNEKEVRGVVRLG